MDTFTLHQPILRGSRRFSNDLLMFDHLSVVFYLLVLIQSIATSSLATFQSLVITGRCAT